MTYARIAATGGYLPERVMTNREFEAFLDTTDEWIRSRSGIVSRHIAAENETTSDMSLAAAKNALEQGDVDPAEVDLIVLATTTPDKVFPSTACIVQRRLGIRGIPAFDVHAACSGFIYALDVADRYMRTGGARCALVVGAEMYSRVIDWKDRGTCVLFGDGAGAVVLRASEEPGVLSAHSRADGRYEELLHVPFGISRGYDRVRSEEAWIQMKGNEVFRQAVSTLNTIAEETLAANNASKHDVAWLIPHQANLRIIAAAAKKLDLPMDRVVVTVDRHANTSSASIPLALDVAVRDGRIQRGELLLFEAFGAGFTWGSALVRY
ncbi:MAG TPA: beta-ketoacyl-ACP synthase III [Woeseiaceae bacterium]|jgi:3-oxoacyl-[acyl-carrier-protein] synthase-3|nr:beta-ketoacyl-ACP synthase III [Woeseiaceae bacterium]